MTKIRIIIGTLAVGGCEKHLSYVLPKLVKRGFDVTVITLGGPNPLEDELTQKGVKICAGKGWYSHTRVPTPLRQLCFLGMNTVRLLWYFNRDRKVITHFFLPHAYVLAGLIAVFTYMPAPLVMSRRSMNYYQKKHPLLAKIEGFLHRKMTRVIGNSEKVCAQLCHEEGVTQDKIGLIYNGIETASFPSQDVNIPKNELTFITVANLIPYKGHRDLIEAFSLVKDQLTAPWRLLLVGRNDGLQSDLEKLIEEKKLTKNISFLGSCKNISTLLKQSDVFILPSHEEGFSNAILEAMAEGLPVIATDVGGNAEAVISRKTGLIVPPHNSQALSDAILTLAKDETLRHTMGGEGRKRLHQYFSLKACVDQYAELYTALDKERSL